MIYKNKNNYYSFMLSLIIIFSLAIIILLISNFNNCKNNRISFYDDNVKIINFKDLTLIPGHKTDYTVLINGNYSKNYILELFFLENNNNQINNYLYVELLIDDEVIYENTFNEAKSDTIRFSKFIKRNEPLKIKVVYYLDKNTGNEIQNEEIDIELKIIKRSK
ncbi:MAG: hypothetical protein J6K18_05035 [Bacilli bacterium]|nr:hypothetical protein [Bacilli bacterium]